MRKKNIFRYSIITACLFGLLVNSVFAQVDDPSTKARKVGVEADKIYKNWLKEDVLYIITKDEKRAYEALKTNEEKENFIENFWRRRDPNPDTEENEYKEEFFERIAYANEHYASGIPGWKTDRGRIYIAWGKPDGVESHPMGGSYNRPTYEGGGSTSTYAFETWFYRYLEGVGSGIEIEFVDPTGTGEYRIARNANEKDAMQFVPGAGLTTSEMLGLSNKGDRISGINNGSYVRDQDSPFRKLELINALSRAPQVKFNDLAGSLTDSGILDNNPLDFEMRVDFFRQSEDRVVTTFTIQTENKELVFEDSGGIQTAKINIFGRITAVTDRRAGIFEDSVTASSTAAQLADEIKRKSIYQKAIALAPGTYRVDVAVQDIFSGKKGIQRLGFTVPRYDDKTLATSTMILAAKLRETNERDIGGMFIIGNAKVIPNLSGIYKRGEDVGIYMQVYNAGIDQTTLRPAVDVEYVVMKNGKELLTQKEDWSGLSDSGQRLTLARLLPTAGMELGEYEVKIRVKDNVGSQKRMLEPTAKFTVIE